AGTEGGVLDLGRRPIPVDALGLLRPEPVRIPDRAGVHLLVFGVVDEGALLPLRRNIVDLLRHRSLQLRRPNMPRHGSFLLSCAIMRRWPDERQARISSTLIVELPRPAASAPRGTGGRPRGGVPDGPPTRAYNAERRNAGGPSCVDFRRCWRLSSFCCRPLPPWRRRLPPTPSPRRAS